jgi:WS/DGAT/MGAT family acyltransferase
VDGPVDVRAHVESVTADAPGEDPELALIAERIMSEPLERSRPLWKAVVIDGLTGGRVAVGIVFHHAAADGLTASMVVYSLLDLERDGRKVVPVQLAAAQSPSTLDLLARGASATVKHPVRAVRAGAKALPHLDQVPMMRTIPGAARLARGVRSAQRLAGYGHEEPTFVIAPRTRFNAPLSGGRRVAAGSVPLETVKALKRHHDVSFNDIVMAGIAGGLRRRLSAGDELPAQPLLAFVPANVRPAGDTSGGNAISSFVVPIPTHEDDGDARVAYAHRAMADAKARHAHVPATLMEDANAVIPPALFGVAADWLMRFVGSGRVDPPVNLIISNVPGPPATAYLDGIPMVQAWPLSLIFSGVGLNATVVSVADRLEIGLVGDAELVPDICELLADVLAEFDAMAAVLPAQRAPDPVLVSR